MKKNLTSIYNNSILNFMKFEKIATEIGKLVDEKDAAYGSSFLKSEKILKILYPNGIEPNQYKDMLAITRIIDKLFRIATKKDAFGENPFKDIAGYGILGVANGESEKE
tara:strand:- start:176 stop:502 length:327 start_codon:yes stop_codon:yes gene_type:complete